MSSEPDGRRRIPRTDVLLSDPRLERSIEAWGGELVKAAVRESQDRVRTGSLPMEDIVAAVLNSLPTSACSLQPVINATGVVLHTNLGRAPLSDAARRALQAAAGYVDVEFDLATGNRARRGGAVIDALLARVPAAEDALVVNNGAAALLLAVTALAGSGELLVSRGELVEIGDGFRLPTLIETTGARLREVGTTNRTHLSDYADAVADGTRLILKIHPSNFLIQGFTSSVTVDQLRGLGVPVVVDIGSGLLQPDPLLTDEPDATSALQAGAAIVTASGDKLLGGPQAGLVLGSREAVEAMRRHPLARALRVDKLTLAALEATLVQPRTPTYEAYTAHPGPLKARAAALALALTEQGVPASVVPSNGLVGGGAAPGQTLSGWGVQLPMPYAAALRLGRPGVVARVEHQHCLLDLRCVRPIDDDEVRSAVFAAHRTFHEADGALE